MTFQRKLASNYTIAWVLWILSFGVIEYLAIRRGGSGDTLSEHVWRLLRTGVQDRRPQVIACRVLFIVLSGWVFPHFLWGWWS